MTAGTSLSEAAVGRPSLLEAVACHPSLSEAAVVVISPSPAPSTGTLAYGTQNQHPPPISTQPPRALPAHSTGTSPRCLHHTYGQHPALRRRPGSTTRTSNSRRRHPLSTTRVASARTGTLSPLRTQPTQSSNGTKCPAPTPVAPSTLSQPQASTSARNPAPASYLHHAHN